MWTLEKAAQAKSMRNGCTLYNIKSQSLGLHALIFKSSVSNNQ